MYCLNSIKSIPTLFSGCQTHFGHFKLSVFYLTHAFNTKCALPLVILFYFYLFKAKICFFPRFQFFFCPHSLNFRLLRIIHISIFSQYIFLRCLFFEKLAMNFYILLYILLYIIILYKINLFSCLYLAIVSFVFVLENAKS